MERTQRTLSSPNGRGWTLADALILAMAERLECAVVTRDKYWRSLADDGLLGITVLTF
jgi:predicted nucleic acid-binding protein